MPNYRMMPPALVNGQPVTSQQSMAVNGRSYAGAPGSVLDVPDFDGAVLAANGWIRVANSGTTAMRPTSTSSPLASKPGVHFLDTTINKFIVFDGITWRDPATGSAV
jgi:hypothetical protein